MLNAYEISLGSNRWCYIHVYDVLNVGNHVKFAFTLDGKRYNHEGVIIWGGSSWVGSPCGEVIYN